MRRKDREMDTDFAWKIVDKCEYAVLAMADMGGSPYCIPISICRDGSFVYFHCALQGKKLDLLRGNPKVCLTCVGDTHRMADKFSTEYESAVIMGTASEVLQDCEKIHALQLLCERHTPTNMRAFEEAVVRSLSNTGIWKINVSQITGKRKKYDAQGKEMKFGRIE